MPTYLKNTRVRRTWRERLLSWPWRPWQATKIVTETITGPYPWERDRLEMINRLAGSRISALPRRQTMHVSTPKRADTSERWLGAWDTGQPSPFRFVPVSSDDTGTVPVHREFTHEPDYTSGGGGDFGGGGASGSWEAASGCDTSTDSGSSDSGSCSAGD